MCYRFFLRSQDLQKAAKKLRALCAAEFKTRHNIAPGGPVPVIRGEAGKTREGTLMHWGLVPSWSKGPKDVGIKMANARSESLAEKPSFKRAFQETRCVIPASGFFEWEQASTGEKLPWLFERADAEPLLLAGLWESWQGPEGEPLASCSIITTTPNTLLARIHDRMPVVLETEAAELWLSDETKPAKLLQQLLVPCADDLLRERAVSTWVNSIAHDDEACLAPRIPAKAAKEEQQLGLGF